MNLKNENVKGITLVGLIITIIILIILTTITINTITHDGLADMAIKGAENYDKVQKDEMNMLNEIDSMVKETLNNIEEGAVIPSAPDTPEIESVKLIIEGIPNGNTAKVVASVEPPNARCCFI